jgi:hypothetical protein
MKYLLNSMWTICLAIAMASLVGCAPITHVTETTRTREYDTTTPSVLAPVAASNTTTTTQYDNGSTVQRTYTQPEPYAPINQRTTTVTTDPTNGAVEKRTTTYTTP